MSELVKGQFARTRKALSQTLEGVSPEVLESVPTGFNNNIHWQVGHILVVTEHFFFKGQEKLPANYSKIFGPGTKPADWAGDIPKVETLVEQLNEQLVRVKEIPSEAFNQKLPKRFLGNETYGELAATGAFHEAMHLGQIQSLKRMIEATQVIK
ncbi:DinB family protein [Oceanobacillus sp. Castelsardo]|uniref:DinB family protein n=1 Tax=Oceanobacillus sp. Castelsardo TaxID=1851204 RepID=UPI000839AF40|nr:DinB family protein [Oceanobacillus sp. Castelsardo]